MIQRSNHCHQGDSRGSATIELAILTPALLILIGLAIAAGRLTTAHTAINHAAAAAARQASLQRTIDAARTAATSSATADLAQQGITCTSLHLDLNLTGFRTPVGQPAQVRALLTCQIPLADLAVPGMPGGHEVAGAAVSVLDTWRGRT